MCIDNVCRKQKLLGGNWERQKSLKSDNYPELLHINVHSQPLCSAHHWKTEVHSSEMELRTQDSAINLPHNNDTALIYRCMKGLATIYYEGHFRLLETNYRGKKVLSMSPVISVLFLMRAQLSFIYILHII